MTRRITHRPHHARSCIERSRGYGWLAVIHLAPVAAAIHGLRPEHWIAFVGFYLALACSVGIWLHRYFAHHAFKTSRWLQFLMGLTTTLTFTDPIAFVGKHRLHHRHADQVRDTHRPDDGWWHCWFGSLVDERYTDAEVSQMASDLTRLPEIAWLHRWRYVPGLTTAGLVWWLGDWQMLAFGYGGALALLVNLTSSVNYFCHRFGNRRFATGDESRNNAIVAICSFGEGWHNNHHRYPTSARAGLLWWELDPFYWVIVGMSYCGLVWDVRQPDFNLRGYAPTAN